MLVQPAGGALARPPERSRTLVAKYGAVWIWPGILLAMRRGGAIAPVADATIRFWVSRLHGPEALDRSLSHAIASAAQRLAAGDEIGAQRALDALGLTELSQDGALLMRAVAGNLGVEAPSLPLRAAPRIWNGRDIALYALIFKLHAEATCGFAKGIVPFDEQKHPRWPAGAPDSQGGQFAPAGESDAVITPVATRRPKRPKRLPPLEWGEHLEPPRGMGDNSDKFPDALDVPEEEPPPDERYAIVTQIGQALQDALDATATLWVRNTLEGLIAIAWMNQKGTDYYYQLRANLDPPKTLQELQDAVKRPTLGYQIHHIVEWKGVDNEFSEDQLESPENLVEIPEMKHREISLWYQQPNKDYGWISPREYLRHKSWKEQYDFGIQKLKDFGVLKP